MNGKPSRRIRPVNEKPLFLNVGDRRISPCGHATFGRFKIWVAEKLAGARIDRFGTGDVSIVHWGAEAESRFPYLLNPCECGIYLPMDVDAGPMLSSAVGLARELAYLNRFRDEMEPSFRDLTAALWEMAQLSLETNTVLEIR